MSLAIDVDRVKAVLLADGWHAVEHQSFTLDSYEYIWYSSAAEKAKGDFQTMHGGGRDGLCATGFSFATPPRAGHQGDEADVGDYIVGPLTAILAVRYGSDDEA
jgi:hypothetical protein